MKVWSELHSLVRHILEPSRLGVLLTENEKLLKCRPLTENFQIFTINFSSSHPEVFCKKGVLSIFVWLHVWDLQLYYKKILWHRCFPVNSTNVLGTPFLQNTSSGCLCNLKAKRNMKYSLHQRNAALHKTPNVANLQIVTRKNLMSSKLTQSEKDK